MPRPLAEIAIEEGLATAEGIGRAAEWADRERTPIVVALVRELGVDELALVAAVRRHIRIPVGDPATTTVELDAARELPRDVARRLRVVPLALARFGGGRGRLDLAVADPTDAVALAEVEHLTGCDLEPRLMPLGAVEELIEASYRQLVTEVMPRGTPARPARVPDLALRHRALLQVLVGKGVVTAEEVEAELARLVEGRDRDP